MYKFHCDPGHAWLEVSRSELEALNIAPQVSGYSYSKGGKVYLEEDCDAELFIKAKGLTPADITEVYQDITPIRNYAPYAYTKEARP